MKLAIRCVVIILLCQILQGQRIIGGSSSSSHYFATILIPEERFTEKVLARSARKLLREAKCPIVNVFYITDESQFRYFWNAKMVNDVPYRLWKKEYDARINEDWRFASLIAVRGVGLLSIRMGNAKVRRVALGKRSEDGLLAENGAERILRMNVTSVPLMRQQNVEFWIETDQPLNELTGKRLLSMLGELPFDQIWIKVRNDLWFINDAAFPVFDPFQPGLLPPSHLEYYNSKTMVCRVPSPPPESALCTVYSSAGGAPRMGPTEK